MELKRPSTSSVSVTGRWRGVLLCVIVLTLIFVVQMLFVQFRGGFGSLLGGDSLARTSSRIHGVYTSYNMSLLKFPSSEISVALLVTARAGLEKSVSQVPFLQVCLPSLLKTIEPRGRYVYSIYFGFDLDDPIYDNSTNLDYIRDRFDDLSKGYPFSLKFFRYNGTRGKPVWAWNRLARAAYRDDVEYLYQVNDDVKFVSKNWTMKFVHALKANKVFPGLGVTGPCDLGNPARLLLTQSFVSRVHLDVFRHFYPPLFRNWFSDDWITQVYHPDHLFKFSTVYVNNTLVQSTRYDIDYAGEKVLKTLVSDGRASIEEFLQSNPIPIVPNLLAIKNEKKSILFPEKDKRRWR
ncbi:hypothetical protein Mapa_011434 [Marchantia paleacea]|nr:hypothetical protein Mapa_011434 [Marchantia paleacea]